MQTVIARTCRVLGVDASLRSTGVGIVEAEGSRLRAVYSGVLRNAPRLPLSACLAALQDGVVAILDEYHPDVVAVEGVFYARYVRTTLLLGHARGAIVAQCARAGVPVYEYAPRRVKQAVIGHGDAAKEQIQRMVTVLLHLAAEPPEDAADALAIAICHLHNRLRLAGSGVEPI